MSHFSAMIIAKRKDKGYTQNQLAEKLGLKQNCISNWENGKTVPELPQVVRLADELGVSILTLVQEMVYDINDTNRGTTQA